MPPKNQNTKWQSIAIAITSIVITYLASVSGILPRFELHFYDWLLGVRPKSSAINDVVIVGLTEKDLETLGIPVTDQVLAKLINKIEGLNPTVIGLDFHRNVDVGDEDNEKLDEIFSQNEKLIGVEMTNGGNLSFPSIPAPIQLQEAGRTGGSAAINDFDGIVRRAYLFRKQKDPDEKAYYINSFALSIALMYLEQLEIWAEPSTKGCVKLNQAVFPTLEKVNFFYPPREMDECQTFINYSSDIKTFNQVSFLEVLQDKVPPSLLKNKIVLIGVTDPASRDIFWIPDPIDKSRNFIYGVELHGIVTNQIINTALNQQKVISFPPFKIQYFYLGIWLLFIAFLSNKFCLNPGSKKAEIFALILILSSSIIVVLSGYGLFLAGWVMPTVTTLSLLIAYQTVTYIVIRFNKLRRAQQLLEIKVEEKTQALKEAQQIILEQEKFKVHEVTIYQIAHEINNKFNLIEFGLKKSERNLKKVRLFIDNNPELFENNFENRKNSIPYIVEQLETKMTELLSIKEEIENIIHGIYQKTPSKISQIKKPIDINRLLSKILDDLVIINQKKVKDFPLQISKNYEENLVYINCVLTEIERALEKIIDNCVKQVLKRYQDQQNADYQPKITLTTMSQEDSVLIKIKDNGMGIKPENLNKIFESFWTTKSVGEGLGLGLYIAREIIEEHGGTISVKSELGEWAEFSVVLPSSR